MEGWGKRKGRSGGEEWGMRGEGGVGRVVCIWGRRGGGGVVREEG